MSALYTRPTTVSAALPKEGQGQVAAQSGSGLKLAGMARDEGMTPLEMLDAALAGCLVLSVRIAARKLGWLDRLKHVSVDVTHEKASEGASRVARFSCAFAIEGDFSSDDRQQLIQQAHELCTVGNTLGVGAEIVDVEGD